MPTLIKNGKNLKYTNGGFQKLESRDFSYYCTDDQYRDTRNNLRFKLDVLKSEYGLWETYWKDIKKVPDLSLNSLKINKTTFGDLEDENFIIDNIGKLHLNDDSLNFRSLHNKFIAYYGKCDLCPVGNSHSYFLINKRVIPALTRVLKKIYLFSKDSGYKIKTIHAFDLRYKFSFVKKTERNLKNDLKDGAYKKYITKISNHSLGTAIDINASSNWIYDTVWDMPKEIVEIMREEGFFWGGEYTGTKDAMHFEYKLDKFVDRKANIVFPFAKNNFAESPLKYYKNNENPETGIGGNYALGLHRNLHGGIHLLPEKQDPKGDLIKSMSPGYIVAMRLPQKGKPGANNDLFKLTKSWAGFILLRHDFEIGTNAKEGSKKFHLYSLYMHLASPDYENLDNDLYLKEVSWFKNIFEKRNGCLMKLTDDEEGNVGDVFWLKEVVNPESPKNEYKVYGKDEPVKIKNDGKINWIFKDTPEDCNKIIESLKDGNVVTFTHPFCIIKDGNESIGIIKNLTGVVPKRIITTVDGQKKNLKTKSGYLHWEVLSPEGKNSGIATLIKYIEEHMPDFKNCFTNNLITENKEDNFIDKGELEGVYLDCLSENEKEDFKLALKDLDEALQKGEGADNELAYTSKMLEALSKGTDFTDDEKSDGEANIDDKKNVRPLEILIDCEFLPEPNNNGTGISEYNFKLTYLKQEQKLLEDSLKIDQKKFTDKKDTVDNKPVLKLKLQAPPETEIIQIESSDDSIVLEKSEIKIEQDENALMKRVFSARWRATRLTHLNEWAPTGLTKLYDTLVGKKLIEKNKVDIEILKQLAWWNEGMMKWITYTPTIKHLNMNILSYMNESKEDSVVDVKGGDNSIFGDGENQLPKDAKLDNLHPVTASWFLNKLIEKGVLKAKDSYKKTDFVDEDPIPITWGFITKDEQPINCGEDSKLVIIDEDFGYDKENKVKINIESQTNTKLKFEFEDCYQENGFLSIPIGEDLWGEYKAKIQNKEKPISEFIGSNTLKINKPVFFPPTKEELEKNYLMPELDEEFLNWAIRVDKATLPKKIKGLLGFEVKKNDSKNWELVTNKNKEVFLESELISGAANSKLSINDNYFNIENDIIQDFTNEGLQNLSKLKVSDNFSYYEYRNVSSLENFKLSFSLVEGVQKARSKTKTMAICYVSPDGKSAVIKRTKSLYSIHLAKFCKETNAFKTICVAGEDVNYVDKDFETADKDLQKKFSKYGVFVTVKDKLIQKSEVTDIHLKKFESEPNTLEQFIKITKSDKKITENFNLSDYKNTSIIPISVSMAKGIQDLRNLSGGLSLKFISKDGLLCKVNKSHYDNALKTGAFSSVEIDGGYALLSVNPPGILKLKCKHKELLKIINSNLKKEKVDYFNLRPVFYGINGFSLHRMQNPSIVANEHTDKTPLLYWDDFKGIDIKSKDHVIEYKYEKSVFKMFNVTWGEESITYSKGKVHFSIRINDFYLMNFILHGLKLKVKQIKNGDEKELKSTIKENGDLEYELLFDYCYKKSDKGAIEFEISEILDDQGELNINNKTISYDLTPKLLDKDGKHGESSSLTIEKYKSGNDEYLLLLAYSQACDVPLNSKHDIYNPIVCLERINKPKTKKLWVAKSDQVEYQFVIEKKENGALSEINLNKNIEYFLKPNTSRNSGSLNQLGQLGARINLKNLELGTYKFTAKRYDDWKVRGVSVGYVSGEYVVTEKSS